MGWWRALGVFFFYLRGGRWGEVARSAPPRLGLHRGGPLAPFCSSLLKIVVCFKYILQPFRSWQSGLFGSFRSRLRVGFVDLPVLVLLNGPSTAWLVMNVLVVVCGWEIMKIMIDELWYGMEIFMIVRFLRRAPLFSLFFGVLAGVMYLQYFFTSARRYGSAQDAAGKEVCAVRTCNLAVGPGTTSGAKWLAGGARVNPVVPPSQRRRLGGQFSDFFPIHAPVLFEKPAGDGLAGPGGDLQIQSGGASPGFGSFGEAMRATPREGRDEPGFVGHFFFEK